MLWSEGIKPPVSHNDHNWRKGLEGNRTACWTDGNRLRTENTLFSLLPWEGCNYVVDSAMQWWLLVVECVF